MEGRTSRDETDCASSASSSNSSLKWPALARIAPSRIFGKSAAPHTFRLPVAAMKISPTSAAFDAVATR